MYNNYFNQQKYQPMLNQQMPQQYMQPINPIPAINSQIGLLGKIVESIDVVKAMDIPLDGSISYFPLTDGTAIVSKQLQTDGTSKTIVYKPVEDSKNDAVKYLTFEDLEGIINDIQDLQDMKDELKDIKKQMKNVKRYKED